MAGQYRPFAIYPPSLSKVKTEKTEILSEVADTNRTFPSRDIGVPFELNGKTYLIFGDTFCKNIKGEFVGLVSNTVAVVDDPAKPTRSRYFDVDKKGKARPFIPLSGEEKRLQKKGRKTRFALKTLGVLFAPVPGIDDRLQKIRGVIGHEYRVTHWAFGGGVDLGDGSGYVWFQKNVYKNNECQYMGIGVARVSPLTYSHIQLNVERLDATVFGPDEARIGTFSSIVEGDYIYLYGDAGNNAIILARIKKDASVNKKENYIYWNGKGYASNIYAAIPVFTNMCHGSIVRSKLFAPTRPFLFVGVNAFADSNVLCAASASLEGPWNPQPIFKAQSTSGTHKKGQYMYCIYPHLWASSEEIGELIVSWSEGWPGGVIMAKLRLARLIQD